MGLGALDNVDAISTGNSPIRVFPPPADKDVRIQFSVTRPSVGAIPVIMAEAAGDGIAADIFELFCPIGGPPCNPIFQFENAGPPRDSLGLTDTPPLPGSDVDAWEWCHALGDPQLFFSVDPAVGAAGPADVLVQVPVGGAFVVFAGAAALGLGPGDDIDALAVADVAGNEVWGAGDRVYFSLTPVSPALAAIPAGPADILFVNFGGAPAVWAPEAALGLLATDDVDALDIFDPGVGIPTASEVALMALVAILLISGTLMIRRRLLE